MEEHLVYLEVVREGAFWRVSNGDQIKIWGQMWLPRPTTFAVQSPMKLLTEDSKVKDLFSEDGKS